MRRELQANEKRIRTIFYSFDVFYSPTSSHTGLFTGEAKCVFSLFSASWYSCRNVKRNSIYVLEYNPSSKSRVLLSMIASIWITGAFHEDGFADACDGFGGGYTKERILEIMKDSRIGAFGAIGIILLLILKFLLLSEINPMMIPIAIVSGHAISRLISISLLYSMVYVKEEGKAKPLSTALPLGSLIVASIFGLLPLLLFKKIFILLILIPLLITRSYLSYYFKKHIGGYTDCTLTGNWVLCKQGS